MRWLRRLVLLGALGAIAFAIVRRRIDTGERRPVRAAGEDQWPPIATPPADVVTDDATVALERPAPTWVVPVDGVCPPSHPIKVNSASGIYHVPGGRFYERTVPSRCYAEADDAAADGYRAAKA